MSDSGLEARRPVPAGINRQGAMLIAAALLACGAALLVVDKRGLLDLDGVAKEAVGFAGLALALTGIVYLIQIWCSDRFRVSIGRLMIVIAIIAVMLQGIMAWRRWMTGGAFW